MEKMKGRLDPRVALFSACVLGAGALVANRPTAAHAVFAIAALFALAARGWRICLGVSLAYLSAAALIAYMEDVGNTAAVLAIVMIGYIVQKFLVMALLGSFFARTTTLQGTFAALQAMNVPQAVIVPFMVAMRFFPTIGRDARCLMESLKTRRLATGAVQLLSHPVRSFEYMIVPLLMRSIKVSDELAASALTRGLDRRRFQAAIYPLGLGAKDAAVIVAVLAAVAVLLWLQFDPR